MSGIETIVSLSTLTGLQVVLSVDNIVVIAIIAGTLPARQRDRARVIGLSLATLTRLALLFSIAWLTSLTAPLVTAAGLAFSGRDLLMLAGGLFLIVKAVREMHETLEMAGAPETAHRRGGSFAFAVAVIVLVDIVFSLDSIMATVGMSHELWIMASAVVLGSIVLVVGSGPIMRFILIHPTVKMLALAFVLLIGMALVADGAGFDMPRGYLYFAILFSVFVEALNIALRRRQGRRHGTALAERHLADSHLADSHADGFAGPVGEPVRR